MARSRNLKPAFFMNEELASCGLDGRLLFAGLWCHADREGRLEDRPLRIKAQIFPYDEINVENLLTRLAEKKFILRYRNGGDESYIQIVNFSKHQKPHQRETVSVIPPPDLDTAQAQPRHGPGTTFSVPSPALTLNPLTLTLNPLTSIASHDAKKTKEKQKDPLWDALLAVCGLESTPTPSARGAWNKAVKDLRSIGATPRDVINRGAAYRRRWPKVSLTPTALARRWSECIADAKPAPANTLPADYYLPDGHRNPRYSTQEK